MVYHYIQKHIYLLILTALLCRATFVINQLSVNEGLFLDSSFCFINIFVFVPKPYGLDYSCVLCIYVFFCMFCCCSVAKLCLTLCNPMDCSTPGFPVLHYLPGVCSKFVCWVGDASNHLISASLFFCLQFLPASGSFPLSQLFASGSQCIGASVSAIVLPLNIQSWFPLGLTSLISLQSKGLSRVFSSTTIQKHPFFSTQPFYGTTLTSLHDY